MTYDIPRHLVNIKSNCEKIMQYTKRGRSAYDADEMLQMTINQLLWQICESCTQSHMPDDFKKRHPEIPWKRMIDMRRILIHFYDNVDPDIVWETAVKDIPDLLPRIDAIILSLDEMS